MLGVEYERGPREGVRSGEGGSWIVRVGFFDFFPIAFATKLLNLDEAMLSRDLEWLRLGRPSGAWTRERADWPSLTDFARDHHDLLWEEDGSVDMTETRQGACRKKESVEEDPHWI